MIGVKNLMSGAQRLELAGALLLYEGGDCALATTHTIRKVKGRRQLGPGQLLSRDHLEAAVRKLSGLSQRLELIPDRVIAASSSRLVWWSPVQRRPLWLHTGDQKFTKALNGKRVLHPALLFIAEPGRLHVLALGANCRPTPDTRVYRAPYFNLYHGTGVPGAMCRGNAPYPSALSMADLTQWERCFYETQFTHSCYPTNAKLCLHPEGHAGLWRALARPSAGAEWICGMRQRFPAHWLTPLELTVEEVINR